MQGTQIQTQKKQGTKIMQGTQILSQTMQGTHTNSEFDNAGHVSELDNAGHTHKFLSYIG